jgi:6-phosphogluconate dehydrogenase
MKTKIGYIGLGKMGANMVERLLEKKWDIAVYNRSPEPLKSIKRKGAFVTCSLPELVGELETPRTLWLMVPNNAVESVVSELAPLLARGDTIVDGGNSKYTDSIRRAHELKGKGITFLDAGVSGGPWGARNGACIMVGGPKAAYKKYEQLFKDLSAKDGYGHMGESGTGHFVKMVHNGIEYGMMQALAEGFAVMKESPSKLNLKEIARVYNHQSVITSRLVGWLEDGFKEYGVNLTKISGVVGATGEGEWTVEAAKKLRVPVPIIEGALKFRADSHKNPSYAGKILSTLRNQFGGHSAGK